MLPSAPVILFYYLSRLVLLIISSLQYQPSACYYCYSLPLSPGTSPNRCWYRRISYAIVAAGHAHELPSSITAVTITALHQLLSLSSVLSAPVTVTSSPSCPGVPRQGNSGLPRVRAGATISLSTATPLTLLCPAADKPTKYIAVSGRNIRNILRTKAISGRALSGLKIGTLALVSSGHLDPLEESCNYCGYWMTRNGFYQCHFWMANFFSEETKIHKSSHICPVVCLYVHTNQSSKQGAFRTDFSVR